MASSADDTAMIAVPDADPFDRKDREDAKRLRLHADDDDDESWAGVESVGGDFVVDDLYGYIDNPQAALTLFKEMGGDIMSRSPIDGREKYRVGCPGRSKS